jgi:hypothetical protein
MTQQSNPVGRAACVVYKGQDVIGMYVSDVGVSDGALLYVTGAYYTKPWRCGRGLCPSGAELGRFHVQSRQCVFFLQVDVALAASDTAGHVDRS